MDSTNWKLEFDNKTPIQTKTSPGAVSTETATKSPYKLRHLVGKANQQTFKSTTKSYNQQSKETKLEPYQFEWTNSKQIRNEMSKYSQANTMLLTQEYIILFSLNQFTIASIKTAFTLLIG
jgi:hypothetical protein